MIQDIIGYDKIEDNLWQNFLQDKLHHCNLITGIKGNGKAIFIKEFAKKIISHSHQSGVITINHPDILLIEGKSNKKNTDEKILIDDIRQINNFTNLSSAISKNKIIIIDAIDNMNKNAYNALLKTIEEPNKNIFIFLINHNIGNIPQTIKSRSNIIKIKNLNFNHWSQIIKNNLNEISEEEINNLHLIAANSIGEAILLHQNNWLDIYKNIILSLILSNELEIINFCEKIAITKINFDFFIKIINFLFLRIVKISSLKKIDLILSEESLIQSKIFNMEKVFFTQDKILHFINDMNIFHLDQKYSMLNILLLIKLNLNNYVDHAKANI
ncbi:AAA family ATPase [Rickettsiales bacterium]|nr:AAA family ATPase [Rickettsiales bacterium]MDB2550822.1 AAA family ATPase [Rickettsiales bacterium]